MLERIDFIELHFGRDESRRILINLSEIVSVEDWASGCCIKLKGELEVLELKETYDEVIKRMQEIKKEK